MVFEPSISRQSSGERQSPTSGVADDNPFGPFLERQGVVVLDGGLATELEANGCDLGDELWSARLLRDDPELVRRVHTAYLEAGADCVTGASYQATFAGFRRSGADDAEAARLLRLSVELACHARNHFCERLPGDRLRPLVAASVGPYGAYLADGSEYTGDYDLGQGELEDFHRRRFELLAASEADLLACETIPSLAEARALARLIEESGVRAWISFSCPEGRRLADGQPLSTAVAAVAGLDRLAAVGVNCLSPDFVGELVAELRQSTDRPVIVYPNSGEVWDARHKRWLSPDGSRDLVAAAPEWLAAGVVILGGCCRTRPSDIRRLRQRLLESAS